MAPLEILPVSFISWGCVCRRWRTRFRLLTQPISMPQRTSLDPLTPAALLVTFPLAEGARIGSTTIFPFGGFAPRDFNWGVAGH
jgi:hypothetical protein